MPPRAERRPAMGGNTAPPTMAMMTNEEANLLSAGARFLVAMAKIVGNMML